MFRPLTALAAAALALMPSLASAQDLDPNIAARHAQMDLLAYNLGVVGGMAQGRVPYDATAAQAAATNLYHLAALDHTAMWAEGTDTMSADGTRALPAIWDNMDDFNARYAALLAASEGMMNAAGTDLASLQGAMGALGASCGGCHQTYREAR